MHFPLFDEMWGADEEILLLEAIEMYGLGNWTDVSDHVGTKNWLGMSHYYSSPPNCDFITDISQNVKPIILIHILTSPLHHCLIFQRCSPLRLWCNN